ncbi:hypothetical protein DSO57_1022925 [Entomophthora muscae]|uniref:Uncharacterized protein n=1 Tax=Entomophthora muscae TaxID=34485 RepID=A0ACC2UCI7_9FUNG|nr:hypothetical protein DSO57_1022925 [Entomophthora muscae]
MKLNFHLPAIYELAKGLLRAKCHPFIANHVVSSQTFGAFNASKSLVLRGNRNLGWVRSRANFTKYHQDFSSVSHIFNLTKSIMTKYKVRSYDYTFYYFLSGAQETGQEVTCTHSAVCLVTTSWVNSKWLAQVYSFPDSFSKSPRHRIPGIISTQFQSGKDYLLQINGPTRAKITFNPISLCVKFIFTEKNCVFPFSRTYTICLCEKLFLENGTPDGIIGFSYF